MCIGITAEKAEIGSFYCLQLPLHSRLEFGLGLGLGPGTILALSPSLPLCLGNAVGDVHTPAARSWRRWLRRRSGLRRVYAVGVMVTPA